MEKKILYCRYQHLKNGTPHSGIAVCLEAEPSETLLERANAIAREYMAKEEITPQLEWRVKQNVPHETLQGVTISHTQTEN